VFESFIVAPPFKAGMAIHNSMGFSPITNWAKAHTTYANNPALKGGAT